MDPSTAVLLIICTGLDATWSSLELLRLLLATRKVDCVGLDDSSALLQSRSFRGRPRHQRDTIQDACPQGQRHRDPLELKHHALAHNFDVERAVEHEKLSSQTAYPESGPKEQGGIARLRLVRSLAGVLLLFPACMLVMSNYAVTKGLLQGCSRFELLPLGYQISLVPQFFLWPSPLVYLSATIIWTLLEYVHYQSNAQDEYQKQILGGAIVVGLLPCIGCTSNALGVLVCTTPWIIHAGLLFSDLLHGIWRQRANPATVLAFPCEVHTTRP